MNSTHSASFLRRVLACDAIASGAMALTILAFGSILGVWFDLPDELLREAAIILIPFAVGVGLIASREQPWRPGVWIVIALNIVWVINSVGLLFTNWIEPNALGVAFVLGQAGVVAVLAALEYAGVRRVAATAAA